MKMKIWKLRQLFFKTDWHACVHMYAQSIHTVIF